MMDSSGATNEKLLENGTPSSSQMRKGGLRTMPFIIVNESLEKVASYGIMPNMILYLRDEYRMSIAKGTSVIYTWTAASDILSIFGAFLSDSYLGRFLVIAIGSFSSLLEHEMELLRLHQNEENDKKKKGIALKASSSIQEESDQDNDADDDDDLSFFVKRFNKFLKVRGNQRRPNFKSKRRTENSSSTLKCFECNQPGHLRVDCPIFKKKMEKSEKKNHSEKKLKKAYITWDENDLESSDDSENEEINLCLMAKSYESDEEVSLRKKWYIDSGCSKHMTGDASNFTHISPKKSGHVTYGDNNKGRILGVGKIGTNSSNSIENVLLVEGLKHSLLSVSQLCDKGYLVSFDSQKCLIEHKHDINIKHVGHRVNNVYMIYLSIKQENNHCFLSKDDDPWLWHKRIAHINMDHLNKLISKDLVVGLPKLKFEKDKLCDACQKGKQTRVSFKSKNVVSTTRPLQLLHMDLFGPSRTMSFGGNYYALVIVDDFSRYTWTLFITHKSDSFHAFRKLAKVIQNKKNLKIASIRSDHGGEFENKDFELFCDEHGIEHNFSAPRTPQQNGVVERKNRSLEEIARTLLNDTSLPKYFWAEAVNTACYIMNRALIRPILKKTPYELFNGRKPNISHLHVFGCKCFVLNNGKDNLGKFDAKSDEGIFLGYSLQSKAYRIYNKRTMNIEESIHVTFDESNAILSTKNMLDDIADSLEHMNIHEQDSKGNDKGNNEDPPEEGKSNDVLPREWKTSRDHPLDNIIGDISKGGLTMLWLTAMFPDLKPSCESYMLDCNSGTPAQQALLFLSMGLISIGAGCVRPCSIAFGADQLNIKERSNDEKLLDSYFNWYYTSIAISTVIALSVIVYIQENLGWKIGFGLPALLMFISAVSFILGLPFYVKVKPSHSLLTTFVQVAVVAVKNRKLSLPDSNFVQYYQDHDSELMVPTDSLRCLNKACIKIPETVSISNPDGSVSDPWSQCTVEQVESLKSLLRILPMWSTGVLMMVSQGSFSTLQANTMDRRLFGNFKMPAGSFNLIMVLTLSIVIPLYDRIMVPLLAKYRGLPRGFGCKTRIGIGLLFVCSAKATSAVVETMRRNAAIEQGFEDQPNAVIDMSVLWLFPEFVLLGIGEAFNSVAQVEFFYTCIPKTMSSFAMALFTLELAAANVVGSVLVSIVDKVTSVGGNESWIATNINRGHLNYYYALLTCLGLINYLYFLAISLAYGPPPGQKLEARREI